MLIDSNEKFKSLRAFNGDKQAMCEMTDLYSAQDDWIRSMMFLELLIENEPSICETIFLETTGLELSYEDMLRSIGFIYYHDRNDKIKGIKWFQKYFEYLDFKYKNLDTASREKIKQECSMYQWMKSQYLFNQIENRFLLKWERELLYKNL